MAVAKADLTDNTSYTLKAQLTTGSSNVTTNPLTVVLDSIAPTMTSLSYDVNESIGSTMPSNVTVAKLTASDNSGGVVKCSLAGNGADNSLFTLVDGVLKLNTGKSYEDTATHSNTYTITVDLTDVAGNTVTKTLTVNLIDVNEAPTAIALSVTSSSMAELPGTGTRSEEPSCRERVSSPV